MKVISSQRNLQRVLLITKWRFGGTQNINRFLLVNRVVMILFSLVSLRLIVNNPEEPMQQAVLWNKCVMCSPDSVWVVPEEVKGGRLIAEKQDCA